jgi:hypothetical protein
MAELAVHRPAGIALGQRARLLRERFPPRDQQVPVLRAGQPCAAGRGRRRIRQAGQPVQAAALVHRGGSSGAQHPLPGEQPRGRLGRVHAGQSVPGIGQQVREVAHRVRGRAADDQQRVGRSPDEGARDGAAGRLPPAEQRRFGAEGLQPVGPQRRGDGQRDRVPGRLLPQQRAGRAVKLVQVLADRPRHAVHGHRRPPGRAPGFPAAAPGR